MAVDYLVKVTACEPLPDYRLRVKCSDGACGVFDMTPYIGRGMFKAIATPEVFNRVYIAFGVPTWPGGVDIAAERVRSDMLFD